MVRNDLCSIVQRLSILLWPWPGPGPTPTGSLTCSHCRHMALTSGTLLLSSLILLQLRHSLPSSQP